MADKAHHKAHHDDDRGAGRGHAHAGHPGHPGHGGDAGSEHIDWEELAALLERGADLHGPLNEQALAWLSDLLATPAPGAAPVRVRRVLDLGSGPGVVSCLLARAFPDAEVIAVDGTPALLDRAAERATRMGLEGRVHTHHADLPEGLAELAEAQAATGGADLIWVSQVLHHLGDQRGALRTLSGLLRPGGMLALVEGGLPSRFLPRDIGIGRPGLQARMDAATEDWFTRMRAALPDAEPTVEDWPGMLAESGLVPSGSRTFLVDLPAPLDPSVRELLRIQLARQREMIGDDLAEEDLAVLDRLLDPDDEAGLLRRPDPFVLSARTVHTARLLRATGHS